MRKNLTLLLVVLLLLMRATEAQTPAHSQFWLDKITTNPALCGDDMGINLNGLVRTQWTRITSQLNTSSFCGDIYFPAPGGTGLGFGFNAQSNTEGEGKMRTQKLEAALSGWGTLGTSADFSVGISTGMIGKRIMNPDGLNFSDQMDPVLGVVYPTGYQFPSLETGFRHVTNAGILARIFWGADRRRKGPIAFSRYILIGGSLSNLSRTRLTFSDNSVNMTPIRYTIHFAINRTNGEYKDIDQFFFQPYFILTKEGEFSTTSIGSRFFWKQLQCFAAYRSGKVLDIANRDAIVGGMLLAIATGGKEKNGGSLLNISYSYDFTLNGIGYLQAGGTHEIGISYRWKGWRYDSAVMRMQGHRQGRKKCAGYW